MFHADPCCGSVGSAITQFDSRRARKTCSRSAFSRILGRAAAGARAVDFIQHFVSSAYLQKQVTQAVNYKSENPIAKFIVAQRKRELSPADGPRAA
jgi:hypothetical protein